LINQLLNARQHSKTILRNNQLHASDKHQKCMKSARYTCLHQLVEWTDSVAWHERHFDLLTMSDAFLLRRLLPYPPIVTLSRLAESQQIFCCLVCQPMTFNHNIKWTETSTTCQQHYFKWPIVILLPMVINRELTVTTRSGVT